MANFRKRKKPRKKQRSAAPWDPRNARWDTLTYWDSDVNIPRVPVVGCQSCKQTRLVKRTWH